MADEVMALFEEYAASFARGEQLDLRGYLGRAGDGADELARLIDAFLIRAEPPEPSPEAVAAIEAWLPLVQVRARRGLKRDQVVDALIERFGLDRGKREKVRRYYHQLETGLLRPSRRLVDGLEEILGTRVSDLIGLEPRPLLAAPVYYRADQSVLADMAAAPASAPEPEDEIDRLFRPEP